MDLSKRPQGVVLDSATLNPGDLSWQRLAAQSDLTIYEQTAVAQIVSRAQQADFLLTNKVVLDRQVLLQLPRLKYIGVTATGINVVDLAQAHRQGITVTNVPGYAPESVAQMVFAHLLHHTSAVAKHHQAVQAGYWHHVDKFSFTLQPLQGLVGKTLGVIGFGDIGRATARIAQGFGMQVIFYAPSLQQDPLPGCRQVSLAALCADADVVSLHCPQTAENRGFVDAKLLATMKSSSILINTARGGLINEADLATALNTGVIAGAGLDVLSHEPPKLDNPLLQARNCTITPHNAWATYEARANLLNICIDNLESFWNQQPKNTC